MQPFKERQVKPYKCRHCPKSFKSSNGLKYHSEKVHFDEESKMEEGNANEVQGMIINISIILSRCFLIARKIGENLNKV